MARQDIFATLSDDILGERCNSSSTKGKVSQIDLDINTDKFGKGSLVCWVERDEKENPLRVTCRNNLPKEWFKWGD